jgi:NitT/TauT family transport system ATP-binding protein
MEAHIRIQNVNKVFIGGRRQVVALQDINLDIAPGQFTCLLGPSGCGKSTLLNAVAGFAHPTGGSITVDGKPVVGPGPERGMVFQEYALFPWMTVENNIAFGLEIKGLAKARIAGTVEKLLHMLSLLEFRARYPADRIVVMTYRPGTVKRDLIVDLPRLRDPASYAFNELKRELGHLVMEEQQRHHHDGRRMAAVD